MKNLHLEAVQNFDASEGGNHRFKKKTTHQEKECAGMFSNSRRPGNPWRTPPAPAGSETLCVIVRVYNHETPSWHKRFQQITAKSQEQDGRISSNPSERNWTVLEILWTNETKKNLAERWEKKKRRNRSRSEADLIIRPTWWRQRDGEHLWL